MQTYPTQSEAIGAAFAESEEGEEVAIHESHCALAVDETCSCTPMVHVVRRGQA